MTGYDDETLMRRIDGELSPEEGRRVDAAAETDPELAARLRTMTALRTAARAAFPAEPDVRDRALARLIAEGGRPRPSPWSAIRQGLQQAFPPQRAPLWAGLATAAFVGGVLVAPMLDQGGGEGFALTPEGRIADASLVRVLETRLASEGADDSGRAVALTFRDLDGRWCRTFQAGDAGVAGLACRGEDGWALRALAPLPSASGEVRTASAEIPPVILSAVDESLAGDTLGPEAEAQVRDAGWR